MRLRTPFALATTGFFALAATLGTAFSAAAVEPSPDEMPRALADAGASADGCPEWSWDGLQRTAQTLLNLSGRGPMELTSFDGWAAGAPSLDLRCLTEWEFTFGNPRDPAGKGAELSLSLTKGTSKIVDVAPRAPLPPLTMSPEQAIATAAAHGYGDAFSGIWLGRGSQTGEPTYTITTSVNDRITVNATTGKVANSFVPDLPDSVIAWRAGHYTGGTQTLEAYTCPTGHPYLWNHDDGLGLNGTTLLGYRIANGITAPNLTTVDGLVSGWQQTPSGITTDDPGRGDNVLYALCTSDAALGYAPPAE